MAHHNTVFAQVLKLVPRHEFESLARKHKSGRMARSMTRWSQFVAMAMAQLTGRCSLRDVVSNLAVQSCKLYHLGVDLVTRSSLARVNAEKPWELYEELHGRLLERCQAKAPGHGHRFKAKLYSLDSTTVNLCLSAFPWAKFPSDEGGGEGARGPGPSGVPADVRSGDGREDVGHRGGAGTDAAAGQHRGGGPGVRGLRVDFFVDFAGSSLGDAFQAGDQVLRAGDARMQCEARRDFG